MKFAKYVYLDLFYVLDYFRYLKKIFSKERRTGGGGGAQNVTDRFVTFRFFLRFPLPYNQSYTNSSNKDH